MVSVTASVQVSSDSEKLWNAKSIDHLHSERGNFIRCKICLKHHDILKRYAHNQQIPLIATENGVRFRFAVIENHLAQDYHKESVKVERIKLLQIPTQTLTPMDVSINKANKKQADYVGKLLIQIYTDAKRLTLSAWNWPIRYVAAEASHAFSIDNDDRNTIPTNLGLQYINPRAHLEFMTCIVESNIAALKTEIDQCLAISIRIDGSVDRTQVDKIYVLVKIITCSGASKLLFFGVSEQRERLATGLLKTAFEAMENQFGREFLYNVILKKISSICTDGTNVNTGQSGGIWALLEEEIKMDLTYLLRKFGAPRIGQTWLSRVFLMRFQEQTKFCPFLATSRHISMSLAFV